jgi:GGDEF domain-containing protein
MVADIGCSGPVARTEIRHYSATGFGLDGSSMAFAAVAALAALSALALWLLSARSRRTRADDRLEAVLGHLDRHLEAISTSLERVVERSADARAQAVEELELTIDLRELLRRIAAEAAGRTGADAAVVHVIGAAGAQTSATFGAGERPELLEAPSVENASAFRAVTINWTYRAGTGRDGRGLSSALVVPIFEGGVQTGSLATYVPGEGAFGPEQVRALERLAEEASPAIASARRYADARLVLTDPETGLRNEAAYRAELERAVAHAAEAAEPLSLLVLSGTGRTAGSDDSLRDLARLLGRLARAYDVVCRRARGSLAVLLPGATGVSAQSFHLRVLEAASNAALLQSATYDAGLVEWRPGESADGLDARAETAVGDGRTEAVELRAGGAAPNRSAVGGRDAFHDLLVHEIARARQLERPLSLLVLDVVDELRRIGAEHGPAAAANARAAVESGLRSQLRGGPSGSWLEDDALALALVDSTAGDAEGMLTALREAQRPDPAALDWSSVSAGITELARHDDAASVVDRARHALWRAKRAGRGTVVLAMAADDPRP